MAMVSFINTTQSKVATLPIKAGQLIFTDEGGIYWDKSNVVRVELKVPKGSTITSDAGAPNNTDGNVGDWYINTTTCDMYEKTAASTWTVRLNIRGSQGANGSSGTNGSKIYSNTGIPNSGAPSAAVQGDWCIDTTGMKIYEKTSASAWTDRGSIKGADGATGSVGSTGADGTKIFVVTTAITTAPSGSRVNDLIINGGTASLTIGGKTLTIGDIAPITTLSALTLGNVTGNIRGAMGSTGSTGATGAAAGFGTPAASANSLPAGASPTVTVTPSGSDTAKVFTFSFGIPKGDTGVKGTSFYPWFSTSDMTNLSQMAGSAIGDCFVNTGVSTVTILGQSCNVGDIVQSTSATAGSKVGTIRGSDPIVDVQPTTQNTNDTWLELLP